MRNIIIIGGSSGIGRQLALQSASASSRVYATYFRHKDQVDTGDLSYHYCNVLDEAFTFDFLPERIDGLVYCPGSIMLRPFNRIAPADFSADFQLQVLGAIKVIQALLPRLKAAGGASVVLFSTVAVQAGLPYHSLVSVSKGAVEGLTKALAAELAPGIRVNCIAPSLTETPLADSLLNSDEKRASGAQRHPLKRIGQPKDLADLAEFLLSEKSGWITGQVIHADGGLSTLRV